LWQAKLIDHMASVLLQMELSTIVRLCDCISHSLVVSSPQNPELRRAYDLKPVEKTVSRLSKLSIVFRVGLMAIRENLSTLREEWILDNQSQ
jgi:hypothetical protein